LWTQANCGNCRYYFAVPRHNNLNNRIETTTQTKRRDANQRPYKRALPQLAFALDSRFFQIVASNATPIPQSDCSEALAMQIAWNKGENPDKK